MPWVLSPVGTQYSIAEWMSPPYLWSGEPPHLWGEALQSDSPGPLCNSGEMMAQKAFVLIIEIRRRRETVTSQQTGWGWERFQATMSPWPRWSGQPSCTYHGAWSSLSHPFPQPFWPRGASINVSFPLTAQTIS